MKKIVLLAFVLVLLSTAMIGRSTKPVEASGTIFIRADGRVEPDTANITSADNVTYTFTGNINESIVVERDNIVVDGAGYTLQGTGAWHSKGINLTRRSNVTIKNMEIKAFFFGIYLVLSSNNTISGNNMTENYADGIYLSSSSNNSIYGNSIKNNENGILFYESSNCNSIYGNTITANYEDGIMLYYSSNYNNIHRNNITNNHFKGIVLWKSSNNTISGNNITANGEDSIKLDESSNNILSGNNLANNARGIHLYGSSNCTISGNTITANDYYGVWLRTSVNNNTIYHNNFVNNPYQVYTDEESTNIWDDGYPSGGNYWDDYGELDTDGDGIGETPYVIDANNQDRYPLVVPLGPIPIVWDGMIYPVELKSNSTISRFQFKASQKMISFNVTGPDDTLGFCNLTIPNSLVQDLWQDNFTVLVDGEKPIMMNNWTDGTYTYIYFIYLHSTHEVEIIPEFPILASVLLILTVLTVAIAIYKRRLLKTPIH